VRVRVKLCGIRSDRDLEIAVRAGADAIGVICGVTHASEDALAPQRAHALVRLAPPFVTTVLVTHLADAGELLALAGEVAADVVQVHGLVSPAALEEIYAGRGPRRVVRAVHVTGPEAVEQAVGAATACDAVLLDSRTDDRLGGTGRTHDWAISRRVRDALAARGRPVILAGGLRPENVAAAIAAVRPFAVDANSGVEDAAGDKCPERCAALVRAATAAGAPLSAG